MSKETSAFAVKALELLNGSDRQNGVRVNDAGLIEVDVSHELWREYDFHGRIYRIQNPVKVLFRVGGSTHRVVDGNGTVYCVPGPGYRGCIIRWVMRPGMELKIV